MDKSRRLGKRHKLPEVEHNVFIATPAYDGRVHAEYAMCLGETCMHAVHQKIGVAIQTMGNGAFIEIARNTFVRNFLETECTHLFFIDADLKWESRAFIGLVQSGREVCCGVYRKRQEPEEYPVRYKEDPENPGIQTTDGGWVACERVPTGFLCIQRHVVEKMASEADWWHIPGTGDIPALFKTRELPIDKGDDHVYKGNRYSYMGEDFAWSDDYRKMFNTDIWVWPDFDFEHAGFKGNWHKFMNDQCIRLGEKPVNLVRKDD